MSGKRLIDTELKVLRGAKKKTKVKIEFSSDSLNLLDVVKENDDKPGKNSQVIPWDRVVGITLREIKSRRSNKRSSQEKSSTLPLKLSKKEKFGSRIGLAEDFSPKSVKHHAIFSLHYSQSHTVKKRKQRLEKLCVREILLKIDAEENYETNFDIAKAIQNDIRHELNLRKIQFPQNKIDPRKPILILVNPKSGPGKAMKIFSKQVEPLLKQSQTPYDLVVTKRIRHGQDLVASEDLSRWSGIVIISGDGLLYEVYQGLFKRDDWRKYIKMPIGLVAGGSGNGLARSLSHELNRVYNDSGILGSTLNIIQGNIKKMDLIFLQTKSNNYYSSFLSLGTGYLSDVDIESEKLRFMGEPRFTLYGLYKILKLKSYKLVLTYMPARPLSNEYAEYDTDGRKMSLDDVLDQKTLVDEIKGQQDFNEHYFRKISESSDRILGDNVFGEASSYGDSNATPTNVPPEFNMPPFSEPLRSQDGWVRVEDEFIVCYAVNVGFIGSNLYIAPEAKSNDGFMWLILVRKGISKASFTGNFPIRIVTAIDTGGHATNPDVEIIPVTAFRMEPQVSKGYLTVDGETLPKFESVQAQILPEYSNIIN